MLSQRFAAGLIHFKTGTAAGSPSERKERREGRGGCEGMGSRLCEKCQQSVARSVLRCLYSYGSFIVRPAAFWKEIAAGSEGRGTPIKRANIVMETSSGVEEGHAPSPRWARVSKGGSFWAAVPSSFREGGGEAGGQKSLAASRLGPPVHA